MTDKQAVIDALGRLPENASLNEIAEELRIMPAIFLAVPGVFATTQHCGAKPQKARYY